MNNEVFENPMENMKLLNLQQNIKLATTERRRNYLVSELNYHTTKFFKENLLPIVLRKTLKY